MAKQSVRMDRMGLNPELKTPHTKLKGLIPDFGVELTLAMTWHGYDANLFK